MFSIHFIFLSFLLLLLINAAPAQQTQIDEAASRTSALALRNAKQLDAKPHPFKQHGNLAWRPVRAKPITKVQVPLDYRPGPPSIGHRARGNCRLAVIIPLDASLPHSKARWLEIETTMLSNRHLFSKRCLHVLVNVQDMKTLNQKIPFNISSYSDHVNIGSSIHYERLFNYANAHLEKGTSTAITNSDIVFDPESFWCSISIPDKVIWALTRRPHPACPKASGGGLKPSESGIHDLCLTEMGSADTWIFRTPFTGQLPNSLHAHPADANDPDNAQNLAGSSTSPDQVYLPLITTDTSLTCHLKQSGYKVLNPCHCFNTYHLSCANKSSLPQEIASPAEHEGGGDGLECTGRLSVNSRTPQVCVENECRLRHWTSRHANITLYDHPDELQTTTRTTNSMASATEGGGFESRPRMGSRLGNPRREKQREERRRQQMLLKQERAEREEKEKLRRQERHERQAAEAKRLEQLAIKRARIRKLDEEQKREYQERLRSRDNLEREVDKPHAQIDETSELASETMLPKAGFYTTFIIFLLLILVGFYLKMLRSALPTRPLDRNLVNTNNALIDRERGRSERERVQRIQHIQRLNSSRI